MIPIVEEKVKKYGGSVIGKETSYTHGGVYKVAVPYDLIKNFGEINMSLKQPGTIPIVMSSTNAQELNNIRIGKKSADEQKLNQRAKLRKKRWVRSTPQKMIRQANFQSWVYIHLGSIHWS